jgi:hypothetical protein
MGAGGLRMLSNSIVGSEARKTVERLRSGVEVALEELMVGRDYARVEAILRALSSADAEAAGTDHSIERGAPS